MDLSTSYIYENEWKVKEIAECKKTNKQMNFLYKKRKKNEMKE